MEIITRPYGDRPEQIWSSARRVPGLSGHTHHRHRRNARAWGRLLCEAVPAQL